MKINGGGPVNQWESLKYDKPWIKPQNREITWSYTKTLYICDSYIVYAVLR